MEASSLSTLDFLYLTLGVGVIILVIILTVLIIHATLLLRDVRKITNVAGDVTEKFHGLVMKPIGLVSRVADTVAPHVEDFAKAQVEKFQKKKAKKSKK